MTKPTAKQFDAAHREKSDPIPAVHTPEFWVEMHRFCVRTGLYADAAWIRALGLTDDLIEAAEPPRIH